VNAQLPISKLDRRIAAHPVVAFLTIIGIYAALIGTVILITGVWNSGWAFPATLCIGQAGTVVWSRRRRVGRSQ
jgi:hypothetical protein